MTRCPHCKNPLAPSTVHHLRARGPNATVCRVLDVAANFAGLVGLPEEEATDA